MFYEISITPCHSGFGEYDANICDMGDGYESADEILFEITNNGIDFFELGKDELPVGLENISGAIHNQPGRVFGWLDEGGDAHYFGIRED